MLPMAQEADCPIKWMSKSRIVGPRAIINLFFALKKASPDILYALTGVPNIWGRPFAKLFAVPIIAASWRGMIEKQLESILSHITDLTICNADALQELLINKYSIDPKKIAVITNAVDCNYFSSNGSKKAKDPTALFIGRYVVEKDPITLLEAFRLVTKEIPTAKLILTANGELEADVKDYIKKLNIEGVTMLPGRPDNRDLLQAAWVFVMSSIREGSPNVILEAMSMGLPVVGTAVGGIPELIANGENGLLTAPSDPQALAKAIITLFKDSDLRKSMGKKARSVVESCYAMTFMARKTEDAFIKAIENYNLRSVNSSNS